jgi:hypothetical protein
MPVCSSLRARFTQPFQATSPGSATVRLVSNNLNILSVLIVSPDLAGSTKRATGQAIQIAVGNLAGGMSHNNAIGSLY